MVAVQFRSDSATIHIHDEFCSHVKSADIPQMMTQIGALISGAYLRDASERASCEQLEE